MPAVMRRKPSPRLSAILAACDPTRERSLGSRSRALFPSSDAATPGQSAGGVRNRAGGSRDLRPNPRWVRTPSKPLIYAGRQRSRPAHKNPQVTWPTPLRPRTAKQHEAGFESHLTAAAGQRPLPTRQASPRTGLTLPPRWCHRRQARAMFTLIGRAPDVPYASVDSGHSRTTRVGACSLRAVGSLHTERSEGTLRSRPWTAIGCESGWRSSAPSARNTNARLNTGPSATRTFARMHRLEPTTRAVLRALDPDLANFNLDTMAGEYEGIRAADRGLGMLADLDDVATRLRPEAPTLPADQLHPWVWDAARTFWDAGAHAVAVEQAAKSITAHTQQKTGCQLADDDLMSQVWSDEPPKADRPRLRFPGDATRGRGSPGSGVPARWPKGATAASGTSSPMTMRRTGRHSSPLSTWPAYQFWPAGSTRPRSKERPD
jgi:hypothetical protein